MLKINEIIGLREGNRAKKSKEKERKKFERKLERELKDKVRDQLEMPKRQTKGEISINDHAKRKLKLKNLFAELIAIQYPLKSVDFAYYKSLFSMIKSMHASSVDKEILSEILYTNTYFISLNNTCL